MIEVMNFPKPSVEIYREYNELCKMMDDPHLTDEKYQELLDKQNDITMSYDMSNYEFTDPDTGKKGVKNPIGEVLIPAEYEAFTCIDNLNVFSQSFLAAKKDGKFGVVAADGMGTVLSDFRFDHLFWNPFTGFFEAQWDGVKDKFGIVSNEGKVLIPNVLTGSYDPCNDFVLLVSDGKFGAIDVSTFCFVLPEYDYVDVDPDGLVVFQKDGVEGYVVEETGEFVTRGQYEEDEKYTDVYVYNTNING